MNGIARLMRFDSSFADSFQVTSRQTFWSFSVVAPGLPIWLLSLLAGRIVTPGTNGFSLSASLLAAFLISWLILPASIFAIGKVWNRKQDALNAIYFYNFWALTLGLVFLPFHIFFAGGSPSGGLQIVGQLLNLSLLAAVIIYETYALRTLLRVDGAWALALVVADLGVTICIDRMLTPAVLCIPAQ